MSKIKALYVNEIIKISKKPSILIMLIIMIVGIIALGGLMRFQETFISQNNWYEADKEWVLEEMNRAKEESISEAEKIKAELAAIDKETDPLHYNTLSLDLADFESQIEMYQTAIDENIMLFSSDNFLIDTLYSISNLQYQLANLKVSADQSADSTSISEENQRLNNIISDYREIIKTKDFTAYINLEKKLLSDDPTLSPSDKEAGIKKLNLWYVIDSSGGIDDPTIGYQVNNVLSQFENMERSLNEGVDYTSYEGIKPLTPDSYDEMENQLAVLLYKIENNMLVFEDSNSYSSSAIDSMISFGSFMVIMMMLILAGGSISQEIATGSIKSLIISPVRRWKIFTAKVLSLLTVGLLSVLIIYFTTLIGHGVFFGFSSAQNYVFANNGLASSISFPIFLLAELFVRFIDIVIFMAFALMLSVITRNTAAAVGISMASYFGHSIAKQIIMFLPPAEWIKFLPFGNLGLIDQFFPFKNQVANLGYNLYGMTSQNVPTLTFSLIYLTVLFICLIYTALDSFNRRDIK